MRFGWDDGVLLRGNDCGVMREVGMLEAGTRGVAVEVQFKDSLFFYNYDSYVCTCVNVPSALMLAMEPPSCSSRSPPTLSWVVLCWVGK